MSEERIFFDPVKIHRDWYFVEYSPPVAGNWFATAQLVILSDANSQDVRKIVAAMEFEAKIWFDRYPVALMVSAFDLTDSVIRLQPERAYNHLIYARLSGAAEPGPHWRPVPDTEGSVSRRDAEELKRIYSDVPFRTKSELVVESRRQSAALKTFVRIRWALLMFWLVVIPVSISVLGVANPIVGWLTFAYSLWMALVQVLKLCGRWPESTRELRERDEMRVMRHHHYHCAVNPEGFRRLLNENLERQARERLKEEALKLKRTTEV